VVQAALKLVLEPVFEADFLPCSYGFRPNRRAWDAVAEVRYLASHNRNYEWVVEGDIKACFDEISHTGLTSGSTPASSRDNTRSAPDWSAHSKRATPSYFLYGSRC
jgi:hypothetical protein